MGFGPSKGSVHGPDPSYEGLLHYLKNACRRDRFRRKAELSTWYC
jgi:hypothetical protein